MCGRYNIIPSEAAWADVARTLGPIVFGQLQALEVRTDVRPTDPVPVVYRPHGESPPIVDLMRWGLIPHFWSKPELPRAAFNARVETVDTLNLWKDAFRFTRALMPATSWIEWQKQVDTRTGEILIQPRTRRPLTVPHLISDISKKAFFFAALFARNRRLKPGETILSCTILTMEPPSRDLLEIHDRAPIVLKPEYFDAWLDPAQTDAAAAREILRAGHEQHFLILKDRTS